MSAIPNVNVDALGANNFENAVDQLNALLRGEISAAETYRMAIDSVKEGTEVANAGLLRQIQTEHGRAAQSLREHIRDLGGQADDSSGVWGVWAKTVQGTMNLFGDVASLKALKEGEEHGLKDYQNALEQVDVDSAQLFSNQTIPAQKRHIDLLDQLIAGLDNA